MCVYFSVSLCLCFLSPFFSTLHIFAFLSTFCPAFLFLFIFLNSFLFSSRQVLGLQYNAFLRSIVSCADDSQASLVIQSIPQDVILPSSLDSRFSLPLRWTFFHHPCLSLTSFHARFMLFPNSLSLFLIFCPFLFGTREYISSIRRQPNKMRRHR